MFEHLEDCHRVLICGCGGGYDIFCGLPIIFELLQKGKQVILGNYTFTENHILQKFGQKIGQYCYRITKETPFDESVYYEKLFRTLKRPPLTILQEMGTTEEQYIHSLINSHSSRHSVYFPEFKLVHFLFQQYQIDLTIYCLVDGTVGTLINSYRDLIELEKPDAIILVDGGTDSLMSGNEENLGTPYEDICHLIAVNQLPIKHKFLYMIGFNTDRHHGITDTSVLHNIAQLTQDQCLIGSLGFSTQRESVRRYIETYLHCSPEDSIANAVISSSFSGFFGEITPQYLEERLQGQQLDISPLSSIYWIFDLEGVCHHLKYDVNALLDASDAFQIVRLLDISGNIPNLK